MNSRPEFAGRLLDHWAYPTRIELDLSRPGIILWNLRVLFHVISLHLRDELVGLAEDRRMSLVKRTVTALFSSITLTVIAGCESAPVTERSQFIVVPEEQAIELGTNAYQQIRSETPISNDPKMNQMVRQVGQRVASVADDPGYAWEFTVFNDDSPNAFALPGGKVGVNTGLFKVAKNENQLAAVIAHEIAHAVARHSAERMSSQMAIESGLAVAGAASGTAAQYSQILAQAATLALVLPFSREQEAEADEIGLIYMARAGYDPRAAVDLWKNFAAYGGDRPPEFLSTHPAPGSRIDHLQEIMPKAMEIYRDQSS